MVEHILINCEVIFLGIFFQHLLSCGANINICCKFKHNAINIIEVGYILGSFLLLKQGFIVGSERGK